MFFDPVAAQSRVTTAWVQDLWTRYPCVMLESGKIRTGAVRLSFPHLFKPQPPDADNPTKAPTFAMTSLFPAGADLSVLIAEAQRVAVEKWGAAAGNLPLHSPFRDQREKAHKWPGYVPGSTFIGSSTQRRPPVVDTNLAPIVEEGRVYPGCWVIPTLRCYAFDTPKKKGVSFGLESIMLIADDEPFGQGGSDPNADFAGVQIEQAVNPAGLFNAGQAAPAGQPAAAAAATVTNALFGGAPAAEVDPASLM